jgi:hypothetical protein
VRRNTSLRARCKLLIHEHCLENLTGETVIEFATEAARRYKFSAG